MKQLRHYTLLVQSVYTLITAVWPLVHLRSFMQVTGYKVDQWLVITVSLLLLAIGVCLLLELRAAKPSLPVAVLALLTACGMAFVDFYYALNDRIRDIYMADGVVEVVFIVCWLLVLAKWRSLPEL